MKSYSIQQKPCQVIAEGCSYQLQRYKNNLKKQMILQENRKIDRNRLHPAQNNWHKSHSRFYSSLFTKSPETLYLSALREVKSGPSLFTTLHHTSPLLTFLHRQLRPDVQLFISGEQDIALALAIFCPDQAQNETS